MDTSEFKPYPYTFTLVDFYNKPLLLKEGLRDCIVAPCPPFHILLDHTIAVLWLLFSADESCPLRSVHINWALRFLQGMVNEAKASMYAEDVLKAIEVLESAMINFMGEESGEAAEVPKAKPSYGEEEGVEDTEGDEGEEESDEEYKLVKVTPRTLTPEPPQSVYKSILLNAMLIKGTY